MSPDAMRTIDFWVGIPLAFFFTLWYKVQRFFGLKDPCYTKPPQNVLFIELAEMGSTILAYPALRVLKKIYPNSSIYFLTFKQNVEAAHLVDLIPRENVFTIDSSNLLNFIFSVTRLVAATRKRNIDTVINLEAFARFSAILSYLTGARKRVGFFRFFQEGLYIGDFLTHKVPYNPHLHTAHSFIALVRALQEQQSDIPLGKFPIDESALWLPKMRASEQGKKRVWEILRSVSPAISEKNPLVVLNPNAGKLIEVRKWPLDQYASLAKKIVSDYQEAYVVITGTVSETTEGEFIRALVKNERVLNLAGKTTLRELVDLFSCAKILVTNDSGPAHFASLTDTHIMVFFGPETPLLYKPLSKNCTVVYSNFSCSPCVSAYNQRRTACNANMCLKSIEVEEVYRKVKEVL